MKIGFITMHRVLNYGSVLQAYALQQKIKELGVDNEIIDYQYHPDVEIKRKTIVQTLIYFLIELCFGFPLRRKKKRFQKFFNENLDLTPLSYTQESIAANPPCFDAYLSGSDQVWNPQFIKGDTSFLLSFVPEGKSRVAYASSFAINEIPENMRSVYARELNKFKQITVRERSGISIVKSLTGVDANLVCDPTLLLDKKDWSKIAAKSELKIREKYILVYVLSYMYNPYPEVYNIVDKVQRELGDMKVIYLIGRKDDLFRHNSRLIKDAGPNEFVYLFQNAEFVITTSFHGTVFSLIFGKPFYSVVKSLNFMDGRMQSLLKEVGCDDSLIEYKSKTIKNKEDFLSLKCKEESLILFRDKSKLVLENILINLAI